MNDQRLAGLPEDLQLVAEQDLVGVAVLQDGVVKYCNSGAVRLSGYSPEEIKSWKPYQFIDILIHPDDRALVAEQTRKKLAGATDGVIPRYSYRIIRKDGETRWVEHFSNTRIYNGAPAIVLVMMDVTESHLLDQKLRDSEAIFRSISEQSSLGILILQNGRVLYANQKFAEIMMVPLDRLVGSSLKDVKTQIDDMSHESFIEGLKTRLSAKQGQETAITIRIASASRKVKTLQLYFKGITISQQPAILITALDVTAKADLENVLAEEEKKFRVIAEQSALGIVIIQDGKLVYVNDNAANLVEKKAADMIGHPFEQFLDLAADMSKEKRLGDYKSWLAGIHLGDHRSVLPLILPSGKRIAIEVFSKSIDFKGKPAILATALDVTSREKAEQELAESEEKFHFIAEKSLIGIIFIQAGMIKYVNDHAASIYGYSPAEMLGWNEQHLLMKIHPSDRVPGTTAFLDQIHSSEMHEATYRVITRDGKVKWIQATSGALPYRGEKATLLVIRDATDAKESEIRLKESEEKYRQVFEESTAAIVLISMKGVLIDCNSATEDLFKIERSQVVGKPLREFLPYIELDGTFIKDVFKNMVQNKPIEPVEFEVSTAKGFKIWVRAQAARIKYGKTNAIQIIINDITEKKKLERILEQENIKLKHLDTIRKNFIFTATHELKTPLVSLYGASEFLLKVLPESLDERIKTMIDIIHRGAERLKALVDNLLDVSRMDTGNFQLNKHDVDLGELVLQTISNLEYLVKTADHEILLNLGEKTIVNADKIRMEQVFTNLLTNAIKNTPKGGRIEINLVMTGNTVKFSIKDNGIGLTTDEMGELFKQFGKLERTDLNVPVNIQGSGLGLYITRNIIEMHGGTIWAESAGRNKGATFSFTIPAGKGDGF
ncbi:MAG: PAS domain S-box protein [Candidatus Sigynarchaeota archaeon]